MNSAISAPSGFIGPVLDAIRQQAPAVQTAIWAAIDRGDLTWTVIEDGRIEFRAGGQAFVRLQCAGVIPVAPDGRTH